MSGAGPSSASAAPSLRRDSVTSGGFKTATLNWRIENFLARLNFADATGEKSLVSDSLCVLVRAPPGGHKDATTDGRLKVEFSLEIRWNPPRASGASSDRDRDNRGRV